MNFPKITSSISRLSISSVVTLACLVVLAAPNRADEKTPGEQLIVLLEQASEAQLTESDKLCRSIESLGPDTLPVLFAVLDTGIIPSNEGALELSDEILGAVWAAFGSIPESALRKHVTEFAQAKYKERTRITALKVIGSIGRSRDLELLGQLSAPEDWTPSSTIRKPFGYALAKIFDRDPRALREVQQLYVECHGSLRPTLIEKVGRSDAHDRLAVLSELLGRIPTGDPHVLRQIGTIASSGRGTSDEYVCGNVRAFLTKKDPILVQIAARTVGCLRDEGSISELIEIIASEDVQSTPAAVLALRQICGHNFGTNARRWELWYQREKKWWQSEASQVFRSLRHEDPGEVAASLQTLSTHTLYREELATEILCVLDRPEPSLRKLGCVLLGSLGAEGARNGLTRLLNDPDLEVQAAAKAAVSQLTFRVISTH